MVIVPIDNQNIQWGVGQLLDGPDPAEASPNDDNLWAMVM